MRRADRLFQIVQLLRSRRVATATWLAQKLEVSERTIYRDIRDLSLSGVPVEGEAGVGYALRKGFDIPPLMFTFEEIEALVLGARTMKAWADPGLRGAADSALSKIDAVLPDRLRGTIQELPLYSLNFRDDTRAGPSMGVVRSAIREHRKLQIDYCRADGKVSRRNVRPLCLSFVPPVWMVTAWCELREEFRNFRIDRIEGIELGDSSFQDEPGKTLDDFMATVRRDEG